MKQIIIGVIVCGIIIGAVILLWFLGVGVADKFETETEFGSLGQEIIFEYTDGSLESLKKKVDIPVMKMTVNDNEVKGMYYVLSGKASGTGTSNVIVDIGSYKYTIEQRYTSGEYVQESVVWPKNFETTTKKTIPVNNVWTQITRIHNSKDMIIRQVLGIDIIGRYTITIIPGGSLRYSLDDGLTWEDGSLPGEISFDCEVTNPQGSIIVSFESGYEFN